MSDLEKRKKLLVAEAEVYRELLKIECYNLRIYGIKTRRKLSSLSPRNNPIISMSLPIIGSLLYRKRRRSWKDFGVLALLGVQLYNRFGSMFGRGSSRSSRVAPATPTAAEDYLSRSM